MVQDQQDSSNTNRRADRSDKNNEIHVVLG